MGEAAARGLELWRAGDGAAGGLSVIPGPNGDVPCPRCRHERSVAAVTADDCGEVGTRLSDDMLLAGCGTGDSAAALAFVRRFQRTVFGVAVAVIDDVGLAEDIARQAFERVCGQVERYDPRCGSVRRWLTSIVHSLAVDAVRVRRARPIDTQDLESLIAAITQTHEPVVQAEETSCQLRRSLAALPPEQARAAVLSAVHGISARELAEREAIPLGTARSRLRTAFATLHDTMATDRSGQRCASR
jgi:RNA polymerase sigma factor (sigma-70 family)